MARYLRSASSRSSSVVCSSVMVNSLLTLSGNHRSDIPQAFPSPGAKHHRPDKYRSTNWSRVLAKGYKTGGRTKGTPNKLGITIKDAVLSSFEELGGHDYLMEIAKKDPRS